MKKTNIITIILAILVIGLTGYIVYDKVLSKEETPNNNENTNINQDDNNNSEDYSLKTIKKYVGCIKSKELPNKQGFEFVKEYEYAHFIFEIKEQDKCTITYGGFDKNTGGDLAFAFNCNMFDIVQSPHLELNEITYKPANVVMKKVDLTEIIDYNFCKNNY